MTATRSGPEIEGLQYLDHLGTGGYSDVYLYERRMPRMRVAVKVLKDVRLSAAELAQFADEAETMAALADHPYIVQVFSTGTLADGRPYLVMKYYPPPNLGARAARERFSVPDVLRTGVKIASAVETAHRAGILHRDIKPANILVSQYGEPGLTDFGIAGHAAETEGADDLGVSIPWSSPEVLAGTSNGSVQSDVYALGATLWHLLGGRSPFEVPGGDNQARALMARVLRGAPPPTGRADVPASLERLLAQAMAKLPAARPRSALEFAQGLQAVEQEQRFARTDIVVEGLGAVRPPTHRRTPTGGDRTRLRAPTRPSSVQDRPPASEPPRTASEPPTVGRPAVVDAAPVRERAAAPTPLSASTVRRPVAPEAVAEPAPSPAKRRGLRTPHVVAIAAVVVIAAVVLGVLLSSRGGSGRGGSTPPTVLDTQDQQLPGATLPAPIVRSQYDAAKKALTFSWTESGGSSSGSFLYYPAGQPASAKRTTATSIRLTTAHPSTTCIQVEYISGSGSHSAPSTETCG